MINKLLKKFFPPSPYNKSNLPEPFKSVAEHDAVNYVLWSAKTERGHIDRLRDFLLQGLKTETSGAITLWIREPAIKSFTLKDGKSGGEEKVIVALVRICPQEKAVAEKLLKLINEEGYQAQAFWVKNSTPLDYEQNWKMAERSPGLVSISFFKAKKGLSREEFWDYWFNAHTPFAIDIHPLWKYERNRVLSTIDGKEALFDGIVPLHLRQDSDLRFSAFFTNDGKSAPKNALRIYADVSQFINLGRIETVAMREYVFGREKAPST